MTKETSTSSSSSSSSTQTNNNGHVHNINTNTNTNTNEYLKQVWFWEPKTKSKTNKKTNNGVLSESGLYQIVHHEYQPGVYTAFDLWLNPMWQWLTDHCLPIWLAPNAVTALGGSIVCLSFAFSNLYLDTYPNVTYILNGIALWLYYTLDCMDGKQARRTQSSSPLGQLFDHGVDCIANLSHVRLLSTILQITPLQSLYIQCATQFGFFQAQWEEYYTGKLPHAAGNLGTTEVLYGMGFWSIISGIIGILAPDSTLAPSSFYTLPLPEPIQIMFRYYIATPYIIILPDDDNDENDEMSSSYQIRHVIVLIWVHGLFVLSVLSMNRVAQSIPPHLYGTAWSKLISPILTCLFGLFYQYQVDKNATTSTSTTTTTTTTASLAMGILLCFLTIKLIVFGMAKMPYASIQLFDILPWIVMIIVTTTMSLSSTTTTFVAFGMLMIGYLIRLIVWTKIAMTQLCDQLQIQAFRIKQPPIKKE